MPIRSFRQLIYEATWVGPKRVVIAAAANGEVIQAAAEAQSLGMAQCILIDDADKLRALEGGDGLSLDGMEIVDEGDAETAARLAMEMARSQQADVVMKGTIATSIFMKAALDRDAGLRSTRLFSHVATFEIPELGRLLLISDGGVIVAPDINQKVEIVQNAIDVAHKLGISMPKVAVLAASEFVNPKIATTLDAAYLSKMTDRGQIRGGLVDGPLALDNAISPSSAQAKGIKSDVAGAADILIVPDIEAGNLLAKAITYFAHGEMAGVVVGGRAPIIVTSRADSHVTKLVSIALAVILASEGHQTVRAEDVS